MSRRSLQLTDYLEIGDASSIDITGTAITVCCWVYPETAIGERDIISKSQYNGAQIQYHLGTNAGDSTVQWQIGDAVGFDGVTGGTGLSLNVWQHIAGTYDGSNSRTYLNGTQQNSVAATRSIQNTTYALRLFRRNDGSDHHWQGRAAEVAIWNATLAVGEISALSAGMHPWRIRPANLKGYWPLWGNTGTNPEPDLSGNGANASIQGSPSGWDHVSLGNYAPSYTGRIVIPTVILTVPDHTLMPPQIYR